MAKSRLQQLNEEVAPDDTTPVAPAAPAPATAPPPPAPTPPTYVSAPVEGSPEQGAYDARNPPAATPAAPVAPEPVEPAPVEPPPDPVVEQPASNMEIVFPDGTRIPYTSEKWQELQDAQRHQQHLRDLEYQIALGDAMSKVYKPAQVAPIEGSPEASVAARDAADGNVVRVGIDWQKYVDSVTSALGYDQPRPGLARGAFYNDEDYQHYVETGDWRRANMDIANRGMPTHDLASLQGINVADRVLSRNFYGEVVMGGLADASQLPVVKQAGQLVDGANRAWQSMLGRMLVVTDGDPAAIARLAAGAMGGQINLSPDGQKRADQFNQIVAQRVKAKGITNPGYFDTANEAGELAGEIWRDASESGPAFVGGLAEAANPAWWVSGAAGAGVGKSLLAVGVNARVAGFVESAIANGGLPYADRALNAVFINGFTKGVARSLGDRALQTIGEPADIIAALRAVIPDRFTTPGTGQHTFGAFWGTGDPGEVGGISTERARELLGILRGDPTPKSVIAALRRVAAENDDPALRSRILGPSGGFARGGGTPGPNTEGMSGGTGRLQGGGGASPTGALRAHRAQYVDPYSSIADELDGILTRIDDIDRSAGLEWGSLPTDEQLRRLAINEPDGDWESYLAAYRQAGTDEERAVILDGARSHGQELARLRGAPILDGPFLPGDDASTLLAEQQVLVQRAKGLMKQSAELLVNPARPPDIAQTYGIRGKVIKGRQSKTSFEIVDPQGNVVGTARSEGEAAQRAHDMNVAAASEQTTLPGTPEAQPGDLVLENQTVSEGAARAARGPAGEQGMLTDVVDQKLEARATKLAEGGERAEVQGNTVVNGKTRTRIESFADQSAAQKYADALNKRAIAKASEAFKADAQIEGGLAARIGGRGSLGVPEEGAGPMGAQNVAREVLAKETASRGPRFEVRDGKVYDTKLEKVDEILSARADEVPHSSETTALATRTRWASWANKKVANGTWREHQPVVPEGQKLVPEDATVVPPGEPGVPAPPGRPPKQPPLIPEEPRNVAEEGPNPIITRVVDNRDGTYTLGTVDLEKGVVIKGERFADRESAVITAEARNAANDAVTMTENAVDTLSLIEGVPQQPALMSPGQAAAVNRAIVAERKNAERELDATTREVDRARAAYRKRVADDPGYRVNYPGTVPPGRVPAGGTPIALPGGTLVGRAAQDSIGVLGHLRGLGPSDIPGVMVTASRLIGTGLDAGGIARQMIVLGLRRRGAFASGIRATFETYLRPEVVTQRAHEAYGEALALGGGKLHYRGQGEFGGEQLASQKATAALESVPVAGEALRRSQESFNNGLNLMASKSFIGIVRADARAVAKWNKAHPDRPRATMSQETKDRLAWRINHQTGYGYDPENIPDKLRWVHDLASGLYAPEWQASRVAVYVDFGKAIGNIVRGKADAADKEAFWNGALFAASNVSVLVGGAAALGVNVEWDPRATNFARLPLGDARAELTPWTTALSALGVGIQTYDDGTVWADFSAGLGPDLRLVSQLFPVSEEGIGHAHAISAGGNVSDPWNPQGPYDRSAMKVAIDWLTSRGAPGVRFTKEVADPRPGEQRDLFRRTADALLSAYIPMTIQDAVESSGALRDLEWEKVLDDFKNGGHWFSTPTSAPVIAPATRPTATVRPSASGGSLYDKYGR